MVKNEFVVIGLGRFGLEVADRLYELNKNVTVIDRNEELVQRYGNKYDYAIVADTSDINTLKEIGIKKSSTVIVCIGDLDPSIMTCSSLLELGVKNIYVKAKNLAHKRILLSMSISDVIVPEIETAKKMAIQSAFKTGIDINSINEDYSIVKLKLRNMSTANIELKDLGLKDKLKLNIISIIRDEKLIIPLGETKLFLNDEILFVTENKNMTKSINLFTKTD